MCHKETYRESLKLSFFAVYIIIKKKKERERDGVMVPALSSDTLMSLASPL